MITTHYLISESLDGHRKEWVTTLAAVAPKSLTVLTIESKYENLETNFEVQYFRNLPEMKQFIKTHKNQSSFFFLESDKWLPFIFRYRLNYFGILLRPFSTYNNFSSRIRYLVKVLLAMLINELQGDRLRSLGIPFYENKYDLFRRKWIRDDLQILRIKQSNLDRDVPANIQFTLGIFGFISPRKNVPLCISALKSINENKLIELNLQVIGSWEPGYFDKIGKRPNNLYILNKYLEYDELIKRIQETKIVLALYDNIASSGIILESLYFNKFLIIPNRKEFRPLKKLFPENVFLTDLNIQALTNTILEIENSGKQLSASTKPLLDKVLSEGVSSLFKFWMSESSV